MIRTASSEQKVRKQDDTSWFNEKAIISTGSRLAKVWNIWHFIVDPREDKEVLGILS